MKEQDSLFSCPLCGKRLTYGQPGYRCPAGHCFDMAKEGYVHLLPANHRHSKAPGDDKEMVAARTRFLEGGWYQPLREKLCALLETVALPSPVVLDAGCGEGYYTAALADTAARLGGRVAGIDLSKTAIRRAAKRCPGAEMAVASVYHLPLPQRSVDVLVDCFSPLALEEFARVLRPGGQFLYVVPAARHLWELKSVLYDCPYENEEKTEEYPGFRFLRRETVETIFTLPSPEDIRALFQMTPYTWKTPKAGVERLNALEELTVTAQFHIHVFERIE